MTLPRRRLVVLLTLAAAVFLAVSQPRRNDERAVLAAVDASAFASLAGRAPADAGELWERLKAMGVGAVLLREETLADLVERGEVLHFTRAEVEKWRVAGLISAGTGLRGDSLWSKDPKALARVLEALAAAGLDASTSTMAGARGLGLPFSVDLARVPAGFDPGAVASLSAAGLLPVAVSTAATVAAAGHRLWVRTLAVDARRGEILRAAYGRPLRLIVFRPRTRSSLDAELDRLRESLRLLRETGLSSILPASSPPPLPSRRGERAAPRGRSWPCARPCCVRVSPARVSTLSRRSQPPSPRFSRGWRAPGRWLAPRARPRHGWRRKGGSMVRPELGPSGPGAPLRPWGRRPSSSRGLCPSDAGRPRCAAGTWPCWRDSPWRRFSCWLPASSFELPRCGTDSTAFRSRPESFGGGRGAGARRSSGSRASRSRSSSSSQTQEAGSCSACWLLRG